MASVTPLHRAPAPEPPALHARAMDNLEFIRDTMERAGAFTAVSGWGMVGTGVVALIAAAFTARAPIDERWLGIWLVSAAAALAVSSFAIYRKARAARISMRSGPARKFLMSVAPPMAVGLALTIFLFQAQLLTPLPGVWLMLYGTAVITGGAFSVRIVPVMGVCFLLAGMVALALSSAMANLVMGISFCVLHVAFGIAIARRHGG